VPCTGERSCYIHLDELYFDEIAPPMNKGEYVFINAVCRDTEITFDLGNDKYEIKKNTIACIAALCDVIGIFIFVLGIGR